MSQGTTQPRHRSMLPLPSMPTPGTEGDDRLYCQTPSPSNEGFVFVLVVCQRAANAASRWGPSDVDLLYSCRVFISQGLVNFHFYPLIYGTWFPSVSAILTCLYRMDTTHYGLVISCPEYYWQLAETHCKSRCAGDRVFVSGTGRLVVATVTRSATRR